ncbi:hypothetical protein U9M48_036092 [Paspalum notatum var. saurae]|uniref:Uncharacterized protein n=1 Tax=Paspalum notatum var. saurae TaxID=547442 RepID=A0AAQ3XAQ1_PASNO
MDFPSLTGRQIRYSSSTNADPFSTSSTKSRKKSGWRPSAWTEPHSNGTCNCTGKRACHLGADSPSCSTSSLGCPSAPTPLARSQLAAGPARFMDLLARSGPLTEPMQIQLFTAGLQEPLSIDIQLLNPMSLEMAMRLARAYERQELVTQSTWAKGRGILPTPSATPSTTTMPAGVGGGRQGWTSLPAPPGWLVVPRSASPQKRWMNATALVSAYKHLFFIEMDDAYDDFFFIIIAYDDYSATIDAEDAEPVISIHAIASVHTSQTMQIPVALGTTTLHALLASESTHNFISEAAAACSNL